MRMKRGIAVLIVALVAAPAAAQTKRARLVVVPRAAEGGAFYEVTGTGFAGGRALRIDARNREAGQHVRFELVPRAGSFGGVFLGRADDGSPAALSPGTWRVRATSARAAAKATFLVGGDGAVWGGEHLLMRALPGGAALEYDCAHGTIDEPIAPDASGHFEAAGVHYREHGGPVGADEAPDAHPARYAGVIAGTTMTLTVTLTDDGTQVGTFTLELGATGAVFKCL